MNDFTWSADRSVWAERSYDDLDEEYIVTDLPGYPSCSDSIFGAVLIYKTDDLDTLIIEKLNQKNLIWSIEELKEEDEDDESLLDDVDDEDEDIEYDDDCDELIDFEDEDNTEYVITAGFSPCDFIIITEKGFDDEIRNTIWGMMSVS